MRGIFMAKSKDQKRKRRVHKKGGSNRSWEKKEKWQVV